ncbi:testis-expressed protein 47-like isoform X2 [Pantherophis guttatus]|uniref:Testis-expressed protein 47-like isoform X2 n=1 Tax=Pantherophis guttatus TaxID=94885 RepID=A0ABM3Z8D8_PANGU|nr:testis-expressed protein 47-like isoform X2 [Pantherophis guttatus]
MGDGASNLQLLGVFFFFFWLSHCLATATGAQQAMASSQAENSFFYESDDFTFEERSSVYELQLERLRKDGKKSLLHRLIFLAKISPDLADKRYLAEYWEQLFLNLQRQYCQGVGVTGLLLLYPTYIIHILESSSDVLYSVLRDLRDIEQQKRVLVLDAKILVMSHNLPARLFPQWSYKVLNLPERYLKYETSHEEPVEATISECLTTLLKLGKHLLRYPKSPKNLPDHFLEKVPEFIVSQDTIGFLLECQELLSPAQFLHLFEFPPNIQMDSDSMHSLSDRLKLHLDWAALKEALKEKKSL